MSLSGTRGLVRVSQNPSCDLQAAMAAEHVREPEFYRRVTGREYPGEYGEREAARRRGAKFEANLHQNDAALLRRAVGPIFGLNPDTMVVRNFAEELPGARPDGALHAVRLHRTRNILRDLVAGLPVPDLLIQPQLSILVGPSASDFEYVIPDFMVLDPTLRIYVPGEEKSFIVRGGVAERSDLDRTRRQAAVQILALRAECARVGVADRVANRALFVFATPAGLMPAPAFEEPLDWAVADAVRAIRVVARVRTHVDELRKIDHAPLWTLVDELAIRYRESCRSFCVLADYCAQRFAGRARELGDVATDLLGEEFEVGRLVELINGATPRSPREATLAAHLTDAARALGYATIDGGRRSA